MAVGSRLLVMPLAPAIKWDIITSLAVLSR
jgi:hypothetical protein